jgi:AraC-like DNA-binding protein
MDVLADMLASLRLTSGVFLDGDFRAPWAVRSHIGPSDCAGFFARPAHVVAYHYIREGKLTCRIGDGPRVPLAAGEIVLIPRNEPHILEGAEPARVVEARSLLGPPGDDGLFHVRWGGEGARTTMYCGYLGTVSGDNILLRSLPSILKVAAGDLSDSWIEQTLSFAAGKLSILAPEMVGKLAEGLFAEAVRRYLAALPDGEGGWLAGVRDPLVGKALLAIHARYADPLTLDGLADEAGTSRTVLVERFRRFIGVAPMHYLGDWRMQMAARRLREPGQNAASVAYAVGFGSEAAFNRAFKRFHGAPPATWQRTEFDLPSSSAP